MKRVLVTGAGGFVGRHVARTLSAAGHAVVATVRREPPDDLAGCRNVEIASFDMSDEAPLAVSGTIDAVIHCGSALPSTVADPDTLYRTNVNGMRRLLAAAAEAGVGTFINCSSMSVYGRISAAEVDAGTPSVEPDAYGRSKLEGERLLAGAARDGALAAVSIRLPGVVGRGSHDNFLSGVMVRIRDGETVQARNPDALFNNIVHVADLAGFMIRLLDTLDPGHAAFPIAAGDPLPLRRVLALLHEEAGRSEDVVWGTGGHSFLIATAPAAAFGYRPPSTESSVRRFARDAVAEQGTETNRP